MNKTLSILSACALALSFGIPAFAETPVAPATPPSSTAVAPAKSPDATVTQTKSKVSKKAKHRKAVKSTTNDKAPSSTIH